MDFPGGTMDGSPPTSAGDTGSVPGLGGSHVPQSSWAWAPAQLLSLRFRAHAPQQEKLQRGAAHVPQWEGAPTLQWEKAQGNPLQYSFLEKPMDTGAWQVHGIARVRHDLAAKPPPECSNEHPAQVEMDKLMI